MWHTCWITPTDAIQLQWHVLWRRIPIHNCLSMQSLPWIPWHCDRRSKSPQRSRGWTDQTSTLPTKVKSNDSHEQPYRRSTTKLKVMTILNLKKMKTTNRRRIWCQSHISTPHCQRQASDKNKVDWIPKAYLAARGHSSRRHSRHSSLIHQTKESSEQTLMQCAHWWASLFHQD